MGTRSDYEPVEVRAARAVLVELMQILGAYREEMVLVGGWVPFYLFGTEHIGSTDIDIALDRALITDDVYATIRDLLESRGYREGKQPFTFLRDVPMEDGRSITVQIDFLAGEYGGTGPRHRTQPVQNLRARKARGCELALEHHTRISVDGPMPDGAANRVTVRLCEVVPFIVMKGMALYDRMKEKDAWDIHFCIRHFPEGIEELARQFELLRPNGLVEEGLRKIRAKFLTIDAIGPRFVAAFEEIDDADERARLTRDAFERVSALLDRLNITAFDPHGDV